MHIFVTARRSTQGWLAKAVYALPILSRYNPRRNVVKCKDYCRVTDHFSASHETRAEDWYLTVRPSEPVHRQPSISLDESEADKFREGTAKYQGGDTLELPEVIIACIHNAKIEGRGYFVLSRENQIIFESALSREDILEENGILDTLIRPLPTRRSGAYCHLAHPHADAYYHWVVEVLPRLSLIDQFEELKLLPLLLPQRMKTFQHDSLRMAGVPLDRIVNLDKGLWQVDRLYFPLMLGPSGSPSPHAVRWLRKTFLNGLTPRPSSPKRCIYVTRRDAPKRKILNEAEIIEFLVKKGFAIICPGDYSFAEQIEIFRHVSIVVAPHGAGLTNMVFAPTDTILIELFGDNYVNGCYWALANICGQRHAFLTVPTDILDYTVPVERLAALLSKVSGL